MTISKDLSEDSNKRNMILKKAVMNGFFLLFKMMEVILMAATKLIALHINKGKTLAKTLEDRIDYAHNPEKTENGHYISSFECDANTVLEEFLITKRA